VEGNLSRLQRVDLATGEVQWQFTTGELEGSFDHRVHVEVRDWEWLGVPGRGGGERGHGVKCPCQPYLVIEGSVHKAMVGHNVFGGPAGTRGALWWFLAQVCERLGVWWLEPLEWQVERLDWAHVFLLPSGAAVQEYVSRLSRCSFPRRCVTVVEGQSVYVPGTTTTLKLYHKGPEFRKHDRGRLKQFLGDGQLADLEARADCTLRVEVEFRVKALEGLFGRPPVVWLLDEGKLDRALDREVERLLKEGGSGMAVLRERDEVKARLVERYGRRQAHVLYGFWQDAVLNGEAKAREDVARATFYRWRKLIRDAGVAWVGGKPRLDWRETAVPGDFSPFGQSRYLDEEQLERVIRLLAPYEGDVAALEAAMVED
jgi:hypothetical protein